MRNQNQKPEENQIAKRLRLPDLLKGIAIFFMIQVHIMELFIDYPGPVICYWKNRSVYRRPIYGNGFYDGYGLFCGKKQQIGG